MLLLHRALAVVKTGNRCWLLFVLAVCLFGCASKSNQRGPGAQLSCEPPAELMLPVKLIPQDVTNWCWAASGEMAMQFLGNDVRQCDQANLEFDSTKKSCCIDEDSATCNAGSWPRFARYHFSFSRTCREAISWSDLKDQIACKKAPVVFSWIWGRQDSQPVNDIACERAGRKGHMMVARGFAETDGQRLIYVLDPWEPKIGATKTITYEEFAGTSDDHHHWNDFYNL